MAWTNPETFTAGQTLTAASMNAISGNLNAVGGAWTSYTPTWTNVTLGSATQDCAYRRTGNTVEVRILLTLSGSTITGDPEATLPDGDTMRTYDHVRFPLGLAGMFDNSTNATYMGWVTPSGSTYARVRFALLNASGSYGSTFSMSATTPFAWANNDKLMAHFTYEIA